jgi:hypothetical protein
MGLGELFDEKKPGGRKSRVRVSLRINCRWRLCSPICQNLSMIKINTVPKVHGCGGDKPINSVAAQQ